MYSARGQAAQKVCEHIGWDFSVHPIDAFEANDTIYATGTLLKPDEWRELASHDGETIGNKTLKITYIP